MSADRETVERLLGRPSDGLDVISLEETRRLLDRLERSGRARETSGAARGSLVTTSRERVALERLLAWLGGRIRDRAVYLILSEGPARGAVRTTAAVLLPRVMDLVGPCGETIRVTSADGDFGLILSQVGEDRPEGAGAYRLEAWGLPEGMDLAPFRAGS